MRLLGIALAVVLLASCTSPDSPEREMPTQSADSPAAPNPSVIDALPTKAEAMWSVRLRAFGNPVPVGETLVVVAEARQDELDIVGLDRATGKVRWRWPFLATSNIDGLFLGDLVYESADGEPYVASSSLIVENHVATQSRGRISPLIPSAGRRSAVHDR